MMTEDEKIAFIEGITFAIDWNMYISDEDYRLYLELLEAQNASSK